MKDLDEKQLAELAKAFDVVNAAVKDVAAALVKAMQPILEAVSMLMKDPTFQAAVIAALEKELANTPEGQVKKRIDLTAQLMTWRKMHTAPRYCAVDDSGHVVRDFGSFSECKAWVTKEVKQAAADNLDLSEYYTIKAFTPAELAAMPED